MYIRHAKHNLIHNDTACCALTLDGRYDRTYISCFVSAIPGFQLRYYSYVNTCYLVYPYNSGQEYNPRLDSNMNIERVLYCRPKWLCYPLSLCAASEAENTFMLCSESQQGKRQNGKNKPLRTKKKEIERSNSLRWRSTFVWNFLTLGLEFLGYWVNHACLLPICSRTKSERRQSASAPPTNTAKLSTLALAK